MWEYLYCSNGQDQTRVKRAFNWVITFRDFPVGSWQTVDANSMTSEALTFFTKGRAEFYLNDERRKDRVPGLLSSELEPVGVGALGEGGTFKLVYVEPTTRLCIFKGVNKDQLPVVQKIELAEGDEYYASPKSKFLICLGSVEVNDKIFNEEQTFQLGDEPRTVKALSKVYLLDFTNAKKR